MLKFLKTHKLLIGLSTMVVALAASIVVSTLGWFVATDITDLRIDSGVIATYFENVADSDGSQEHPWVIARPVHLFNLMHLQQSNKMVVDPDNPTGDEVQYCKAHYWYQFGKEVSAGVYKFVDYGDDGVIAAGYGSTETYSPYLNMTFYSNEKALIPIGSETYPFIGHVIGNNLTVKNMTVYSNYQSDVGIFGYVANGAEIKNCYFDNVDIVVQDFVTERKTNIDPHIVHSTSASKDEYICAGYIAGHVHDANKSFVDVYVNNCTMDNAPLEVTIKNNFGYFGKVDLNDASPVGSDKHYALHPNEVHTYFDGKYDNVSNKTLIARNTEYGGSSHTITGNPNVSDGITKGSYTEDESTYNSYKFTGSSENTFSKNTSLATSGYRTSNEELYDARYWADFDGDDVYDVHAYDASTTILDYKPEDLDSLEDGKYLYLDPDNETYPNSWTYAVVKSSEGETTTINFNCYTISYVNNGTTYYLHYQDGSVVGTTTAPIISDQETYADYFFAFKDTSTSRGVTSISDAAASLEYKIFIPKYDCYLNASTSGVTSSLTTTNSFSSALGFKVRGNSSEIYCSTSDSYKLWCSGTTVVLRNCTAGFLGTTFSITGSSTEEQTTYTSTYDVVTDVNDLAVNDIISFVYTDSGTSYMIGSQAKNNRNGVTVNVSSGHISDVTGLAIANFKLGQTTNGWTFQDEDTNQYLYAAGTSTSGSNYLRSQDSITTNGYAEWNISINGTTATIKNYGNTRTEYLNYHTGANNDGTYHIFRCSHSSTNSPMVFKRTKTGGGTVTIENSFLYSAISVSPGTKSHEVYYAVYGAIDETDPYKFDPIIGSDVSFNIALSQVILKTSSGNFELVKDISDIHSGDSLVLAYCASGETSGQTAGDISSDYMSAETSTFSSDLRSIETLGTNTVKLTLGGSNGAWTFKNSSEQYLKASTSTKLCWSTDSSTWSIEIDATTYEATIVPTDYSSNSKILYNKGSPRFKNYTTSPTDTNNMVFPYLYKMVTYTNKEFFFGDQIGGLYNPNYIDTVGSVTYKHDSAEFANTLTSYNAIPTSSSLTLGSSFYATQNCGNSTVIFVTNNLSRDLGSIQFSYYSDTASSALITKGGGSGKTFVEAGCTDLDPTGGEKYHLSLSGANINSLAYCGLDSQGNIYCKYDADGNPVVTSDTYEYSKVQTFVIVISSSTTINVTDVEYSFTALPGNTGNFGKVGYRSASYDSNGVYNGSIPENQVTDTIVNFYYEIAAGTRTSTTVTFDSTTSIYNATFLTTGNYSVYIFNYDIMTYTVKANNIAMTSSSQTFDVPITTYDPETGWQV